MKEWISDKKNQPIVIGIASAVILCMVAFMLFEFGVFGNNSSASSASATSPPSPVIAPQPAPPPPGANAPTQAAAPAASPQPSATAAEPAKSKPASATKRAKHVMVARAGKADPFKPSYSVMSLMPDVPRVSVLVPTEIMATLPPLESSGTSTNPPPLPTPPAASVPLGRISGIIFSNGVSAIYESNGTATIVRPGDQLPDGAGRVASIQSDSVTIDEGGGQDVTIPVTAGTTNSNGPNGNSDNAPGAGGPPPGSVPFVGPA